MDAVDLSSARAKAPDHASISQSSTASTPASGLPNTGGPERSSSQTSLHKPGHIAAHRQSFAENQRHPPPPSPRSQRHPSLSQQAVQELLNHPPPNKHANPRFAGRDWRDITIGELASRDDVMWTDMDTSVEDATMTLLKNTTSNVVLVREKASDSTPAFSFDYNDLNAYLLVVVGLAKPDQEHMAVYSEIAEKAQAQMAIPLREIQILCRQEELVKLPSESTLDKAIERFGSGVHRILVTGPAGEIGGTISQLRLLEFFWNEGVNFPPIDKLYGALLRDLQIGSHQIISISSEAPLADALTLMNLEGLTSVAVVDSGQNVVGNISTADVRLLTNAASLPLLQQSCMHFTSVILSERGVERGRDSVPVFHVSPYSTLAHTVAKLVATRSHRMWVVESASPSPSAPATPLLAPSQPMSLPPPPASPTPPAPVLPAAALPGANLSGRLTGVVSLTDVLNLFARSTGLSPADPGDQRARRRRSSSNHSALAGAVRQSLDGGRTSFDARR